MRDGKTKEGTGGGGAGWATMVGPQALCAFILRLLEGSRASGDRVRSNDDELRDRNLGAEEKKKEERSGVSKSSTKFHLKS